MKAVLIISHGSRRKESNAEVARLTEQVRSQAGNDIEIVTHAFLEITPPNVEEAVEKLVAKGVDEILVFPHFLAAGTHVVNDIPWMLDESKKQAPNVQFKILPHLGALPGISSLILDAVQKAAG